MDILVHGRNVTVGRRLHDTAEAKIAKLVRVARDATRVEVEFSEIRNPREPEHHVCEVTVHLPRSFVKAHAAAVEQVAALDLTIDKVEHQLTRRKEKRVDRHHARVRPTA